MNKQKQDLQTSFKHSAFELAATFLLLACTAVGLALSAFDPLWIAGSLGISAAAASQIVAAIKRGRTAATVVGAVFGGGIASALTATITWIIFHFATEIAVS